MQTIKSTAAGQLPLAPTLSNSAQKAAILEDLQSASIISFDQLRDDNCKVLLGT